MSLYASANVRIKYDFELHAGPVHGNWIWTESRSGN